MQILTHLVIHIHVHITVMCRSIRNSQQRSWGGAFDHNTRGVGNLIRRLDFMFRAALGIKTACVCLQMLKQLPYPSVIICEPIFNVADITILFVTSGKTMETDISAQTTSDIRRKSGPEVGHLTTEFSLDVGI